MIIVTSSKGYRANRSIVIHEGEFGSVESPNIDPLVSINIKISKVRYIVQNSDRTCSCLLHLKSAGCGPILAKESVS